MLACFWYNIFRLRLILSYDKLRFPLCYYLPGSVDSLSRELEHGTNLNQLIPSSLLFLVWFQQTRASHKPRDNSKDIHSLYRFQQNVLSKIDSQCPKMILTSLISHYRMFVETCQRLRLMKNSEVVNLGTCYHLLNLVFQSFGSDLCLAQFCHNESIYPFPCSAKSW